ncbi:hypothetical protein ACXWQ2_08975, partial [Streptococcus pyogenes]
MADVVDVQAIISEHATVAEGVEPGTAEWRRRVTASKIAGIMDCDPWGGTPWIMWHQLAGHF